MKNLFFPAVGLMNRLTYAQKFMVLGLIYFIAVVVMMFSLYSHLGRVIDDSQRQLQGISLIKPIARAIQLMQEHRGLELAVLSGNEALRDAHTIKERDADIALQELNQDAQANFSSDPDWNRFQIGWRTLLENQYSLTLADDFATHVALIEQLQQFEVKIADYYGLTFDSDIAIYYLVDTTINKLPSALEQLGQMRAFGTSILTKKQLSEEQKIKLFTLIAGVNSACKSLSINLEKTGHYNTKIKVNLLETAKDIGQSAQQIIDLVQTDILSKQFATPSETYFATATEAINKGYGQMYQSLFPSMEVLLKERIQQAKTELYRNISIGLLSLLVASYIFLSIYYATANSARSLARSAQKFANGDFNERIELHTRDELHQVANSFNEMADGFNALLEVHHDSEERLNAIINNALDAVIQMDIDGKISGWSKQAEVMFGWTHAEALGQNLHATIVPPYYREAHIRGYQNFLKTGHSNIFNTLLEFNAQHREGHEFPVELSVSPVKTARGIEFSAFVRDITERKRTETVLRDSEIRFRHFLQDIPAVAVQSYGQDGIIRYWNKASECLYGYTADEAIGQNIVELLIPPALRDHFKRNMIQAFKTEQPSCPIELTCLHKNGAEVAVYSSYAYVHIAGQLPELFCVDIDLTELKHSEAALREKEQILKEAQEVAHIGYFITDLKTGIWKSSPVLDSIFGIDDSFARTIDNWINLIAPEYREATLAQQYKTIGKQIRWDSVVYKIIRANDGEERWVSAAGQIELDTEGYPIRMVGTIFDITERKSTEDALQLLSLAVEQSPNSIVITDLNARIQFVNKAFSTVTGYSLTETIGKNPRLLNSGKTPKAYFDDMWSTLVRGEIWQGELINRRKDGSEYTELALISPVRQPDGEMTHYLAVKEDISERKRAETELRIAAVAFESQEGILVSDTNNAILRINQAFTTISGYSSEEVVGRTPSLFRSGRQDHAFYTNMWQSIRTTGSWQGEIWNRRKNGSEYPGWMTITAVKNKKAETTHYVATLTDITERKLAEENIKQLAFYDPLTELPNRRKLLERLEFSVAMSHRKDSQLAVLMMDLDYFKAVNDSLGHSAGDELLQQVAKRLALRLRDTDMAARLGGDEFVVLLEDIGHEENAARVASNIIADLTVPFLLLKNREIRIGASIGISVYPYHGDTPTLLMNNADIALYEAKDKGRNCFAYFSADLTRIAHKQLELESRLRQGINQQELLVFYQPQVDMTTGKIIGVEALVRWQDPDHGFTLPNRFLPTAEENGLILAINQWVLKETCRQGRLWLNEGLLPITLAVNVPPIQIKRGDITDLVATVLAETDFPAGQLALEITEASLIDHHNTAAGVFNDLRQLGVHLTLDNFGAGYSSLASLQHFPLNTLNIDKSFINALSNPQNDGEIVASIIRIGHSMGFKVLAEGVETLEQLAFLQTKNCDAYQGFIKSPPLTADDFADLLRQQCANLASSNENGNKL